METNELIAKLVNEQSKKPLKTPQYYAVILVAMMFFYAVIIQYFLGFRSDLAIKLRQLAFDTELLLLILLQISAIYAAVLMLYPDKYQKKSLVKIPFILLTSIAIFLILQSFLQINSEIISSPDSHKIECLICIAAVAFLPSLLIFVLLKKGNSTSYSQAGFFAVLIATIIGCITLRLAENNDLISHLVIWHYLPTLLFACLGAFLGKFLLRW